MVPDSLYLNISPNTDEKQQAISEHVEKTITPYVMRLRENVGRVMNLVKLWVSLKASTEYASNVATDEILRASVVFTHATLEDFLRTLAANLLPEASEQTLNQIPANRQYIADILATANC